MLLTPYFMAAAVVLTAIAAVTDWKTGEIPNALTLLPLGIAPVAHAVAGYATGGTTGAGWGLGFSLLGALACGLVPMILYVVGGGFGGDVKLQAALGAILGTMLGLEAEFYGFLVAALYAPAKLAYEGKLWRVLGNTAALAINPFLPKARRRSLSQEMLTPLRMAPAFFLGLCGAVFLNWGAP
jgi:prepilin peptidase CpaA